MILYFIKAMEAGLIPDFIIRMGIRYICKKRLEEVQTLSVERDEDNRQRYVDELRKMPLAIHTKDANEQHYDLPAEFFLLTLGKNRKYSSCFWAEETRTLDQAEDLALDLTISRAEIKDGHRILELGCGWGSLTLEMSKKFPNSKIVAISNSSSQKAFIDSEAKKRKLTNIQVLTRDIATLKSLALELPFFDRVISVEMFEHFKNYEILLSLISDVLAPQGKLFVHIFTHRKYAYPFETKGDDNWMGQYFFTGGQMPSHDLLMSFQKHLYLEKCWIWNGANYEKTANAWLQNMDNNSDAIMPIFRQTYGEEAILWFQRWRVFFMACAELFGFAKGDEWFISHYLFEKK